MPTSDDALNAKLPIFSTQLLVGALSEFGQGWLVEALAPDLDMFGWASYIPDWGSGYPSGNDPKLIAQMVAFAVEENSHVKAPKGLIQAKKAALPHHCVGRATDLAKWSKYTSPNQFTQHDALRLWSRRVALSLYIDGAGLVPWRLRDFPAWQVAGMLSWRPQSPNRLKDVLEGSWRGHSPLQAVGGAWFSSDFIWNPDPTTAYHAASSIIHVASATTPRAALAALRTWMVQRRALHGQREWTYFACNQEADAPPGGILELSCNPTGVYSISMAQWLRRGWGGCGVNSAALATLLLGVNVPAATVTKVAVDMPADDEMIPPTTAWSTSLRVTDSVPIRVAGGFDRNHNACYAFGSGLACTHGDLNVNGVANGAVYGDDSLSGWLPWRLQFGMHLWADAVSAPSAQPPEQPVEPSDGVRRTHLAQALLSAMADPTFAPSLAPHWPWMAWRVTQATAANWIQADPGGGAVSLRRWLMAVAYWPCGQPMPGLHGLAALLETYAGMLPLPQWQPLFNTGFECSMAPMRQTLARAVRELVTPMSGVVTKEPQALAREGYILMATLTSESIDGSVALRVVMLALLTLQAAQDGAPNAQQLLQLLAAHSYDIFGLTRRSANSPVASLSGSPVLETVHRVGFPDDIQIWFLNPATSPLSNPWTTVCQAETLTLDTYVKTYGSTSPASTEDKLTLASLGPSGQVAGVFAGADPLAVDIFGPAFASVCHGPAELLPPLEKFDELLGVVRCSVQALVAAIEESA